jgi:hypothetical protein
MNTTSFTTRISALMIALVLLGGCKLLDESVTNQSADESTGSNDGTGNPDSSSNSAPFIWGDPDSTVLVSTNYVFQPEASDSNGDVLQFAIANKPAWTDFDTGSGLLQGIPGSQHVGQHGNIVISVSDQTSIVSLPSFAINVEAVEAPPEDDNGESASSPPTISGTPNTTAVAGAQYVFRPVADDPDGDTLSFSVVNKPAWANFNTTTGRLGGYPSTSHIGTSESIEISVTDGSGIAALPRFRITVEGTGTESLTLAWNPPTQNADGSPLTNLAGYRIHYGTSSGDYSETIELNSPGVSNYVIGNLAPGTYYLAMTSVNSANLESAYSAEISFGLGT